jgi:hypothetical protein
MAATLLLCALALRRCREGAAPEGPRARASRANGRKSAGPKSAGGKARAKRNPRRHRHTISVLADETLAFGSRIRHAGAGRQADLVKLVAGFSMPLASPYGPTSAIEIAGT